MSREQTGASYGFSINGSALIGTTQHLAKKRFQARDDAR
jgi:hypothetical protein